MTSAPSGTAPSARGVRRELAEGDALTRYAPGAPYALRFDSRLEWGGWRARDEGDQVRATFPGTAVGVDGAWFEVRRVERIGERWAYYLAPWEERFPLREPRELSADACRREHARHAEARQRERAAWTLTALAPLVGLLPAVEQERLERELGMPAVRMTMISALVVLAPSLVIEGCGLAMALLPSFAAQNPGLEWTRRLLLLFSYLVVESGVRVAMSITGQAAGAFPVVFAWQLRDEWRRRGGASRARRPAADAFDGVHDEVRVVPAADGEDARVEILSPLPKAHWTLHVTPIRFQGALWEADERSELLVGGATRHRFVLVPYGEEMLRTEAVDYSPDEPERLHRQQVIADRQMWVVLGGWLWGLLDDARQRRLAAVFVYEPEVQTRRSTWLAAMFGGFAALLALFYVLRGGASATDVTILLLGLGAAIESVARRRHLDRGAITGSFLGLALRPFAAMLARGLAAPAAAAR